MYNFAIDGVGVGVRRGGGGGGGGGLVVRCQGWTVSLIGLGLVTAH